MVCIESYGLGAEFRNSCSAEITQYLHFPNIMATALEHWVSGTRWQGHNAQYSVVWSDFHRIAAVLDQI